MDECFRLLVPCMRAVEDQVQLWKLNEVESESLIESFCPACDRLRVIVKSAGKANGWGALAAFPDLPERLAYLILKVFKIKSHCSTKNA
eukprot:m.95110 g.95110  ORF g.95110 m.95110 type:complete len:89 (+) comp36835_c1_seq11:22-288(+)